MPCFKVTRDARRYIDEPDNFLDPSVVFHSQSDAPRPPARELPPQVARHHQVRLSSTHNVRLSPLLPYGISPFVLYLVVHDAQINLKRRRIRNAECALHFAPNLLGLDQHGRQPSQALEVKVLFVYNLGRHPRGPHSRHTILEPQHQVFILQDRLYKGFECFHVDDAHHLIEYANLAAKRAHPEDGNV